MRKIQGFSLSELLVVITLSAIVIAIGIPSYQKIIANYRIRSASQQLVRAITQAKECALHNQSEIILCGSGNGMFCDGKWSDGQLIVDKESKKLISIFPALSTGITVNWRSNLGHNELIVFTRMGIPEGQWGSFWIENNYLGTKRIIINSLGRIN
ncbi:MAG: prepilin-type N-terminal cleavage/methylation domain-containing protein [Gammaproteobacteria bacterium]|nr:prepilin-type N-terminal cleavage/methylation domain-containing protein [Gammaproteobacteria bacterium]